MTQQRRAIDDNIALPRKFTGKHMTLILVTFFGIVIGVNFLMANLAVSTFGGVVVENSYVASQEFNDWLSQARADKALGWKSVVKRDGETVRVTLADSHGAAIAAAKVTGVAEHPLGLRSDENLAFHETSPGTYVAPLVQGRWRVKLTVVADGSTWREVGEVL